ncbi:MAG: GNAT family N-acetyltransferase [Ruminococcaceae bacterium]|nr:GNAT family N-acetyltransferase [Oscillospiraceae bacterium]
MIEISGKNIKMRTMTQKEMRALWRKFVPENKTDFVYDEEKVDLLYQQSIEREEWNPSVGIFTKTDEIIGELTFVRIVFSEKRCELSLFLAAESYRNKGYGSEAVMLAKKYAKETLGLKRIYADVSSANPRMQAVMKKCGFQNTKTFKADYPDGSDRLVYFAML